MASPVSNVTMRARGCVRLPLRAPPARWGMLLLVGGLRCVLCSAEASRENVSTTPWPLTEEEETSILERYYPERLRRFDTSTSEELSEHPHRLFTGALDRNRDGVLDMTELRLWGIWEKWAAYYDKDGDGHVNQHEWRHLFRQRKRYVVNMAVRDHSSEEKSNIKVGERTSCGGSCTLASENESRVVDIGKGALQSSDTSTTNSTTTLDVSDLSARSELSSWRKQRSRRQRKNWNGLKGHLQPLQVLGGEGGSPGGGEGGSPVSGREVGEVGETQTQTKRKKIPRLRSQDVQPKKFWQEFVDKHLPVVLTGVESPAWRHWDEEFLRSKYAELEVKLEPRREDRGNPDAPETRKSRATLAELLDEYVEEGATGATAEDQQLVTEDQEEREDSTSQMDKRRYLSQVRGKAYAVSILPQQMAWDTVIPRALLCGSRRHQKDPAKVLAQWQAKAKAAAASGGEQISSKADSTTGTSTGTSSPSTSSGEEPSPTSGGPTTSSLQEAQLLGPHRFPHPKGRAYMTHFLEYNLWMAHGPTESQLHYDAENILFCVYRGRKRFLLIDTRKYGKRMAWVRGRQYHYEEDLLNQGSDWVDVNPEAVDLNIFPEFAKMEYQIADLEPGDCLFQPYSYLHQVNSNAKESSTTNAEVQVQEQDLQVSASFLFSPFEVFDAEACASEVLQQRRIFDMPAGVFDVLWSYSGKGVIPQGYPDPAVVARDIRNEMRESGAIRMALQQRRKKEELGGVPLLSPGVLKEFAGGSSPMRRSSQVLNRYVEEFGRYANTKHLINPQILEAEVDKLLWPASGSGEDQANVLSTRGSPLVDEVVERTCSVSRQVEEDHPRSGAKARRDEEPEEDYPSTDLKSESSCSTTSRGVPLDLWLRYTVDSDDGLACNRGLEYFPRTADDWHRMETFLDLFLAGKTTDVLDVLDQKSTRRSMKKQHRMHRMILEGQEESRGNNNTTSSARTQTPHHEKATMTSSSKNTKGGQGTIEEEKVEEHEQEPEVAGDEEERDDDDDDARTIIGRASPDDRVDDGDSYTEIEL
ncbi:unnamed protein product [Amoebophrya sp. A25]|nr:unnamed protein product [Amoebophrya sp. A25]|eukprot:GSA25T00018222001.1